MRYQHIVTQLGLEAFCQSIASAPVIAFDTEFVSEDTYRPELCLVQVAANDQLAVIDPQTAKDLSPFWELLAQPNHITLVHSGREEFRFCLAAINKRPHNLYDVQVAAALIGLEYPASYGNLVSRLVGKGVNKGETRTDWRRRPLSTRQIEYALADVEHLEPMRQTLEARLAELGRTAWMADEMEAWQRNIEEFENGERWRRTSGLSGLAPRGLAIVRNLWLWRDNEAARRDQPPRRVLRDDLIIELAKRETADPRRVKSLRGMERGDLQRQMNLILKAIEDALALAPSECPQPERNATYSHLSVVAQFLGTALGSICRAANVAPSLVGSAQDVRDLIALRMGIYDRPEPPALAQGWRAEVVGKVIEELLEGKLAIRIRDPKADEPLTFESCS